MNTIYIPGSLSEQALIYQKPSKKGILENEYSSLALVAKVTPSSLPERQLPLSNKWLQLYESQRFATHGEQRGKNVNCCSRSIFQRCIMFCSTDLSLNNSCRARGVTNTSVSDWEAGLASGPEQSLTEERGLVS